MFAGFVSDRAFFLSFCFRIHLFFVNGIAKFNNFHSKSVQMYYLFDLVKRRKKTLNAKTHINSGILLSSRPKTKIDCAVYLRISFQNNSMHLKFKWREQWTNDEIFVFVRANTKTPNLINNKQKQRVRFCCCLVNIKIHIDYGFTRINCIGKW